MRIVALGGMILAACASSEPATRLAANPEAPEPELQRTLRAELHRDDPEAAGPAAAALAKRHGGWMESADAERVRLRVPDGELDAVVAELPTLGKLESQRLVASDQSEAHRDLQVRVDNLRRTRERYLALLGRANTIAETTAVEHELERITAQLELLEAHLAAMEKRLAWASVHLSFSREMKPGPLGWVFYGPWLALEWLFVHD